MKTTLPRLICLLLAGALSMFAASPSMAAEPEAGPEVIGVEKLLLLNVRVGVFDNLPLQSINFPGVPNGFYIDILDAIAKREGWSLQYVPGTLQEGLDRLEKGEIDLLPGLQRTSERDEIYYFHLIPVISSWNQIYTSSGFQARATRDLDGKRIATIAGAAQINILTEMSAEMAATVQPVVFKDYEEAFQGVADGKADAVISNRFYGQRNYQRFGLQDSGISLLPTEQYFAAPRNPPPALLWTLDKNLKEMRATSDSVYYTALKKWGIDEVNPSTPSWLLPVAGASLALFTLSALWVFTLKRQVSKKTKHILQRSIDVVAINRMLRATGSHQDVTAVMDEAVQGALLLSGSECAVLCVKDEVSGLFTVGAKEPRDSRFALAVDDELLCRTVCPDVSARLVGGGLSHLEMVDPVAAKILAGCKRHAYFLLAVNERVLGLLCLYSYQTEHEGPTLDMLADACNAIALTIDNRRLYASEVAHSHELEERVIERTRGVEELAHSLQAIIDHIPDPIFYKNSKLEFLGCNTAYERTFDVKRADIVGKTRLPAKHITDKEQAAYCAEQKALLARGGSLRREDTVRLADDRQYPTLYSVQTITHSDGSPGGVVGTIVDISAMKAAEAANLEAGEEQSAIFEASKLGIALIKGKAFRRVNRSMEEMFGYGPGEMIGLPTRVVYPDQVAYDKRAKSFNEQIRSGAAHQNDQEVMRKDGTRFWTRTTSRLLDPLDIGKGVVGVVEDVTDQRAAEMALIDSKLAAESANLTKSSFLATMSHELRTPLNSIIGFTGIILQGLAGPLTPEQSKQLGMVRDSSRHLLALINDVLDISKIEAGALTLSQRRFDLAKSVQKVVGIVTPIAHAKGLAMSCQISPEVKEMVGDERRVEQILFNLLGNAIKFTEKGSVRLTVERLDDFQTDSDPTPRRAIKFAVVDTGIGIRPDDLPMLFRPFSQIDSSLSRQHEGTGLGLVISRRLAHRMGGDIGVRSKPNLGSTFTVTLPEEGPEI